MGAALMGKRVGDRFRVQVNKDYGYYAVVRAIAERKEGIVYMLWGSYAQRKGAIADPQRNLILKAVHPSPLSVYRGFFGCRHFSRANDYLRSAGKEPIVW